MNMATKSSLMLVGAVLIALIVGGAVGYFARTGEVSSLMSSNEMMHEQMQSMSVSAMQMNPASGPMPPHDVWFVIVPLQGGKFAVVVSAQGLEGNGSYLVEAVTKGGQMKTVPIASTAADSKFLPDSHGNGVYWHVLDQDPRSQFEEVILLYLPNMDMQSAIQVASVNLG
jgi:hypothetical protein